MSYRIEVSWMQYGERNIRVIGYEPDYASAVERLSVLTPETDEAISIIPE